MTIFSECNIMNVASKILDHIYYSSYLPRILMSRTPSPEQVIEKFARGYRRGDYSGIYNLYSKRSDIKKKFSKQAYSSKMRTTAKRTQMEIEESHVAGSQVSGGKARVTLVSKTKSIVGEWHMEEQFTLVQEDGSWRILEMKKVRQWPVGERGTATKGRM